MAIVGLSPDRLAVGRDRDRRMQRMRLAAENEQLAARRLHAVRLGKDRVAEREHLVAADHISLPGEIAHGLGLGARQNFGDVVRGQRPLAADRLAHDGFIEARRLDDEGETRPLPGCAPGTCSPRRGSAAGAPLAGSCSCLEHRRFAVMIEADDRRRGFLDRAARHVDDRPAMARAERARLGDLGGDGVPVDIVLEVVVRMLDHAVLADLRDALGAGDQADDEGLPGVSSCGGSRTPGTSGTLAVLKPRLAR